MNDSESQKHHNLKMELATYLKREGYNILAIDGYTENSPRKIENTRILMRSGIEKIRFQISIPLIQLKHDILKEKRKWLMEILIVSIPSPNICCSLIYIIREIEKILFCILSCRRATEMS